MSLNTYQRLFLATSRVRKVASISTYAAAPFRCARLSPDGRFLAIGSDDGILEIRMFETVAWRRVGLYTSGTAIRAMVWHPLEPSTVFFGSASGSIHKITVIPDRIDIICDGVVPGYVHVLALSTDGRTLAIAHGSCISLVKDPFPQSDDLGTLVGLDVRRVEFENIFDSKVPRGLYFLPGKEDTLIVSSLGRFDFCAYSLVEHTPAWTIPLRPGSFLGSSAISPSGERLAVLNLVDGIDFYSTSHRRFLSTTRYTVSRRIPPLKILVDMIFIDEETVAFGHSDGYVAFATFGVTSITGSFKPSGNGLTTAIQTITFGITGNHPNVFGLVSSHRTNSFPNRWITDIHVGRIDTPISTNFPTQIPQAATPLRLTRMHQGIILTGLLAAMLAMILSGTRSESSADDRAAIRPAVVLNAPVDSQTANICFCTISGTVVPDA